MSPVVFALVLSAIGVASDPNAPAGDPKRVLALFFGAVAVATMLVSSRVRPMRPHPAQLALLGAIAVSALSWCWGTPRGALDLATWVAGAAIAMAVSSRGRLFAMRTARTVGVLLGGAVALHAFVGFFRGARGIAIDGGQGNANWLGLLLCVTLPLAIDALRDRKWLAMGSIALQALALGASHARVAWVAGAIALVVIAVRSRRGVAVAVASLVAIGAFAARGTSLRPTKKQPAITLPYEAPAETAARGRLSIARTAWHATVSALPFGAGLGRFPDAFRDAQSAELNGTPAKVAARTAVNATTAHDEPLQIATESGPIAAALLAIGFLLAVRGSRSWRAGMASLLAAGVCALADDPLRKPAVVLVVAVVLAALPHGKIRRIRAPAIAVAVAACALLLVPASRAWRSDRLVACAEVSPSLRASLLGSAVVIDRGSADAAFALALVRLESGDLERARSLLLHARALDDDASTSIALGDVELARFDLSAAEEAFRHAIARSPGSFRAHLGLAEVLRREGRLEDAAALAKVARTIRPFDVALTDLEERLADDGAGG
ncbi:MAG: tetratricopeptide repeat protein [Polyangiales bacterium]